MSRYLITQSLLSAWKYIYDSYDPEAAMDDFLRVLNREESKPTDAMLDGIAFETEVYKAASSFLPRFAHEKWESGIQKVAERVRGGQFQVKASRELAVGDMTFLCDGILDCLQAGVISDVKFRSKSFGSLDLAGSYLDSPQHPMYFYLVPEAYEFQYLASDGDDLYVETYRREDCRSIRDIISEFLESIKSMGYLELYKEKWLAK